MDHESNKGNTNQELLIHTLVKYVSAQINRSENVTLGLIRQCISEWMTKNNVKLKEVGSKDEETRLQIINGIIDLFFDKTRHIIESRVLREKLRSNVLLIYGKWKETRQPVKTD